MIYYLRNSAGVFLKKRSGYLNGIVKMILLKEFSDRRHNAEMLIFTLTRIDNYIKGFLLNDKKKTKSKSNSKSKSKGSKLLHYGKKAQIDN